MKISLQYVQDRSYTRGWFALVLWMHVIRHILKVLLIRVKVNKNAEFEVLLVINITFIALINNTHAHTHTLKRSLLNVLI